MNERRSMERRIADYIGKVEESLGHLAPEDRDSIADDVDEHIRTALDESEWSLEELDRVLECLGPAATYAAEAGGRPAGGSEPRTEGREEPARYEATGQPSLASSAGTTGQEGPDSSRFCRLATVALVFSVAGYILKPLFDWSLYQNSAHGIHFTAWNGYPGPGGLGHDLASLLSVILGTGLVLGPLLGLIAFGRILASSGKLSGLGSSIVAVVVGPLAYFLIWAMRSRQSEAFPSIAVTSLVLLFIFLACTSAGTLGLILFLRSRRPAVR